MNKLIEQLIISEGSLKLYSNISRNVDIVKIVPYIILAQKFYIEPLIGTALYSDLQIEVAHQEDDSSYVIPENYQALLLKIAPVLSLYTEYLATRPLAYSITEKGITKESSDNSSSLDNTELGQLILDTKNKAELAAKILTDYLNCCKDKYPLYKPTVLDDNTSLIYTEHTGIYFPCSSKKKCGCNK